MSGVRRERGSKWEPAEPDISPDKCRDSGWASRTGSSFHEHDLQSRKYLLGRRGFHKNDHANEESRAAWVGDGRYDTARVSPALDGWRRRNQSRSPRSTHGRSRRSKSRSRSRSPHNPRKDPGFEDGNSYAGSAEICKDFAAGNCRKGDLCHFSHDSSPVRDRRMFDRGNGDGWESRQGGGHLQRLSPEFHSNSRRSAPVCNSFLAGRCRKGSSCRYAHHDSMPNDIGKELLDNVYKEGHVDQRGKERRSCDRYREPHKVSETMCRFFLAGNCRDGKHCRYSHHQEEPLIHERRLLVDHSKWSNYRSPPRNGSEARMWEDDRNKVMDSIRPIDMKWSNSDYMDRELAGRNHLSHGGAPSSGGDDKTMLSSKEQCNTFDSKRGENCFTERAVPSPNSVFKPQTGVSAEKFDSVPLSRLSFPQGDHDMDQGTSSETHHGGRFTQPISSDECAINSSFGNTISTGTGINPTSYSNFNISSSFLPSLGAQSTSSLSALAQGQTFQLHPKAGNEVQISNDQQPVDAKINDTPVAIQENTSEFTNLTSTLAHLIEKQHIALQKATIGGPTNHSLDPVVAIVPLPASSVASEPNQGSGLMRKYGPVPDSIESKLPQPEEQISSGTGVSQEPLSTSIPTYFAPSVHTGPSGDNLGQKDPTEEANVTVAEDNEREEKNEKPENGVHDDDGNIEGGGGDDEKKGKDSKVVRAFKFSLAEFVKELLKPTWKDGQVSKEVYKTIVKKVVDKVSDSIQPAHVPRTKEKINQYLASSKPKLSKLVQAYLEKYQKG